MNKFPIVFRIAPLALALTSVVIAVVAYLRAVNFPFISDDSFYIVYNAKLAGLHAGDLWRLFVEPYNPYEFLPLRDFSYWLDVALSGASPAAFRVHNILLYVFCCLLVYGVTLKFWRYFNQVDTDSAPWVAAIVTALFAIYPSHVEAVVWVSGRKDVLSGAFAMLALWCAVSARREQGISSRYAVAALIALLAAMLSKATTVAVAPVIAMLWITFWRDVPLPYRRRTLLLWPLASLVLAACVAPVFMGYSTIKLPAYFGVEAYTRALAVLGWLLRLAISPEDRHYIYPVFEDPWLWGMVVLGAVVLLAAVAGIVMLRRKRSIEGFSLVAFALLCIPYTQFSPYITHSLVTDRFLFLAVWPAMLLLVALIWRLKPMLRMIFLLIIMLPWAFQTVERPRDWRSYEALLEVELRAYPGHYFPVFQNVEAYLSRGQYREAREMAGTISDPEVRYIVVNLVEGAYAVAVDAVQTGDPRNAMVRLQNLGTLLKQPLNQAQWNTPMFSFWLSSRGVLSVEWETLGRNFPNDASVRNAVRVRQEAGL